MHNCTVLHFNALNTSQLHRIYTLRSKVFIVEQNCVYNDVDAIDLISFHLLIEHQNSLIAYCRIYLVENCFHIGRVVVDLNFRKSGIGKKLMQNAIEFCKNQNSTLAIKISAQNYLIKFYNNLGFIEQGNVYLEDGIPHVKMELL
ncbi:MAG: GNAT family N-acetyltransferase [Bacteroidia bacterium]